MNKLYGAVRLYYSNLVKKHLLGVQAIQTGLLISTGDLLAQTAVEKNKMSEINYSRTSKNFIFGVGLVGPALTAWYRFLSKTVRKGTKGAVVLKKLALDQVLFAPVSTFVCISAINILQGKDWSAVRNELNYKYEDILITGYCVWPFVQFVNFFAVPLKHQVLFVQAVALFWNTYFCWKIQQTNK